MRKILPAVVIGALVLGWTLWAPPGLAHVTTTNTVLFEREIVRILEAHCAACHADEGPASPLLTYEQTWLDRERILASVLERRMPPWPAVPGYGEFANDNRLTSRERQFLVSWVEGLGPRNAGERFLNVGGEPAADDRVEVSVDSGGWRLGEPDLLVALPPRPVDSGGEGRTERVVLELALASARSIRALEFSPVNRRIVRAANFFVEETGQWLGSWTPWYGFVALPEGVAYRLPAGSRIAAEIRYAATSERAATEGSLGLFFAGGSATEPTVPTELALEARGDLPGFATGRRLHAEARMDGEIRVLSLLPQLDPGAKSIEVSVRRPDGGTDVLLFAKDFPLEWPTPFVMSEPVVVPAGSVIRATAYFANPSETPRAVAFRVTVSGY
jgi:hypothetical protein